MTKLEKLAHQYVEECCYEPESFAERCAALSGFKEGFRKAREMAVKELQEKPFWMVNRDMPRLGECEIEF